MCKTILQYLKEKNVRIRHGDIFPIVDKMLPRCYQDVTKMLPRCYQDITKILPRCYQNVTKMQSKCYQDVTKNVSKGSLIRKAVDKF